MIRYLQQLLVIPTIVFGFAVARAQIVTVPLNSNFQGEVADPAYPTVFAFEGLEGIKASITVKGAGAFRPFVRVLDSGGFEVLASSQSDASGSASIPSFVPESSGTYLLEVNGGAEHPTGTFDGLLQGKLPKELKSAKFPKDSKPGDTLTFFALAGTELSGKLRIWTKPHPATEWFRITGPTGVIDTYYQTTYSGFNKYANLKKVTLAETGNYVISPSQPTFRLTGKVKLKPPTGGSGIIDVGDEPFVADLQEPVFGALPAATNLPTLTVTGSAPGADQVEIATQSNVVIANVQNGSFSAPLPLAQNSRNVIFATALGPNGSRSRPAIARVVHDAEPPSLSILTPINNASLVGTTVHVSGVVGDRLSPNGVTVTVNTLSATVDHDSGEYGSFERRDVSLGASTTTITVIARDTLGNQVSKSISVKKATVSGFPTLSLVSGDGQSAVVGGELAAPLVVKVATSAGAAFANKLVEFKTIRGDGLLGTSPGFTDGVSRLLVSTDASGFASVRMRLGSDAGPGANRVTVSSAGIVGVLEFSLGSTGKPASRIAALDGNLQIGPLGAMLPRALAVRVTDGRNPVANASVRFQVLDGGGLVNGANEVVVLTDVLGIARADWRLGRSVTTQRVIAGVAGIADFVAFDARGVQQSLLTATTVAGVVHDTAQQTLGGATAQLFVNGTSVGTTQTALDGRFQFSNVPVGVARIVIDGSTVNLVGNAGTGTGVAPTFTYASQALPPFALTRGVPNIVPLPILLPAFDQGKKTYNGAGDQVFTHSQIDALKATLTSGTVVTLANGQTVPGAAGTVQIGVAAIPTDDLPRSIPDGLAPQIGLVIDPPFARFGTPVAVEAPNTAALPYGARAKLLQFDAASGRFEVSSELVSNGRTLVSEFGTGLTRTGFAVIATPSSSSMSRVDCAGLALASIARILDAASEQVESDVDDSEKLNKLSVDLVDALAEFRVRAQSAVADANVELQEWNSLRAALGDVEDALRDNDEYPGAKRATIAAAVSIDSGFDLAIAEASASDCAAEIATAGTGAKNAYAAGLKAILVELEAILGSRESAVASTRATVTTLRALLDIDVPPADAVTLLAGPTSQFDAAEAQLSLAASALDAALSAAPDAAIEVASAPLVAAFEALPDDAVPPGVGLRAAGQIALSGVAGGMSIRGIPADGTKHVVSAYEVTPTSTRFGESPLFEAVTGVDSAPAAIVLGNAPAASVLTMALQPTTIDVPVGSAAPLALSVTQSYGPIIDATGGSTGTVWRSSDSSIVSISEDGSAGALNPGVVYVTARHKDVVAARKVTSLGDYQVTIFGTAMLNATTPAAGASIVTTSGATTTAAANGSFVLPIAVPSNANNVTLIASAAPTGQTLNGVASFVIESSGPADAGVLTLTAPGNVMIAKAATMVVGTGTVNNPLLTLNNGLFGVSGTAYNTSFCCWWNSPTPTVEFDLGSKYVIFSAILQGDSNDTYIIEILDSFTNTWKVLWDVPTITSAGTGIYARPHPTDVSQKYALPVPMLGTKIRLRAGSGDGNYGVAEIQLFGVITN